MSCHVQVSPLSNSSLQACWESFQDTDNIEKKNGSGNVAVCAAVTVASGACHPAR